MDEVVVRLCTAFDGHRRIAAGPLTEVAVAVQRAVDEGAGGPVHIYDDESGKIIDFDPRGPVREEAPGRGRGRPRLGVVAREVTLLPRHWEWLNNQPGGASVAIRKLVEAARRANGEADRIRAAREAGYRFLSAMGGDLPGFEEASRALFAHDRERFAGLIGAWPEDVRVYALRLAFPETANGKTDRLDSTAVGAQSVVTN